MNDAGVTPTQPSRQATCLIFARAAARPEVATIEPAMPETILRLQGLKCPLPVLHTRKALRTLASGDVMVVECTDPMTAIDIPVLLRQTGDILEASEQNGDVLTFRIRKP